jgi:hypothetical protein
VPDKKATEDDEKLILELLTGPATELLSSRAGDAGENGASATTEVEKLPYEPQPSLLGFLAPKDKAGGWTGRSQDKAKGRERSDECTIMVMGLHPKTDERSIYQFFVQCGKICDVQIVKDPHSGRSKGNGYVEFYEASSVLKAINFSGTPINGQPIRVQPVNMPRNLDVPETPLERQVRNFLSENGLHPEMQGATMLKQAPPEVQRSVLTAGNLMGARNPSAVLVKRVENLCNQRGLPAWQIGSAQMELGQATVLALSHMFDPSTVDLEEDPDFYEDVEEDVAQECARYGTVVGAIADRTAQDGRVIVKFGGAPAATSAQAALNGRTFGGQSIRATAAADHEYETLRQARQALTSKPLVSAAYTPMPA